ncbi:RagB/SusD family nutrient uptake outer membrane protein [Lutibacter maritimus]|uniref:Starch-binding associating with outer membrane n=1 Tax=Lutibacter maritimus TaxID=593133 RepID=A0A1I6Q8Q5_9FLAO|nr:RagB/SusD family nutrient uptake outer membrane protein [Lutibacter maritimus]SFS48837.1 Starch-binding associating with outer membrane [Lutibacter maritimus]
MKLKIYRLPILAVALLATIFSCSEDYLEVDPSGQFLSGNYYANETEAFAGLVAEYDFMRKNSGGFENMVTMMNAGSDDHYAGGGNSTDGAGIQSFSNYTLNAIEMPSSFWSDYYKGIFRANMMILKLPDVPMDETLKARYMAESKALRAYYHFNLVRLFKNIPLFTAPVDPAETYNVVQSTPEEVYAQIEIDLLDAIAGLPTTLNSDELGRFTKGAAQAVLGKVYLEQGKKAEAAAQFAAVNGTPGATSPYGYKLLANFNDLWQIDNKFNTESILEVTHTNLSLAGWGNAYNDDAEGNMICTMVGPRGFVDLDVNDNVPAYSSGWSFNPIIPELYDLLKNDPRFEATVLDLKALSEQGKIQYSPGYQDTGYFLNKFAPTVAEEHTGAGDMWLNHRQNSYVIRLADTYLLEAEALNGTGTRAQALLDAVRARVGLPSIPVSMDNILAERRLELAGEGHRWFDLRRNGKLQAKLASRGFVSGKHEIFPIPYKELENTKLVQNPNY